jgi:hypothetical protein
MATLNDFFKTDLVDDHVAEDINVLISASIRSEYKNIETLSADRELTDMDTPIQRLECGAANRVVKMPTPDAVANHPYVIVNASAAARTLTVKDNAASVTYAILLQGEICFGLPEGDGGYHFLIGDAPADGTQYARKDHAWEAVAAGGGASFWTTMAGTPTRISNTTFTVTGDVTASSPIAKGMVVKWTESGSIKLGMVSIPPTYSAPNSTITIIGDTMASIDAGSLKYASIDPLHVNFPVAGTIGATGTDVAPAWYAKEPYRVLGADIEVGTAGTTNNTTADINKGGTTMFTTKPTLATTVAASPTPFTADSGTSLALNDKVTIDIDAIQTTAAIDLYVTLYLFPTRYLYLT